MKTNMGSWSWESITAFHSPFLFFSVFEDIKSANFHLEMWWVKTQTGPECQFRYGWVAGVEWGGMCLFWLTLRSLYRDKDEEVTLAQKLDEFRTNFQGLKRSRCHSKCLSVSHTHTHTDSQNGKTDLHAWPKHVLIWFAFWSDFITGC